MRTITIEVPVELPGDQVFARLTEQGGFPEVNMGTSQVDAARRRLSWQDGEFGGEVAVSDRRPGTCAVQVEVRTDRDDDEVVRTELQRAVAALAQRALAEDSTEDTGRAWH